jgi:hypothetical protein
MAGIGALPSGAPARPAPSAGMMDLQTKMRQAPNTMGPPPPRPPGISGPAGINDTMPQGQYGRPGQRPPPVGPGAAQAQMPPPGFGNRPPPPGAGPMAGPPQMGARPTAPIQRPMTPPGGGMSGGAFGMKPAAPQRGGAFGAMSKAPTAMGQAAPFAGSRGNR